MVKSAHSLQGGRVYCALFDGPYTARAMPMWESPRAVSPGSHLHVCCFDEASPRVTRVLEPQNLTIWSAADLEGWDPEFASVREQRSRVEYLGAHEAETAGDWRAPQH